MSKSEPKTNMKEGSADSVKSIWKLVSELLYNSALSPEQIHIFEVLTDYINNIEERLSKLENNNKQ